MNIFDEDDDYMVTSPAENFFGIIHNANKDLVNFNLEKLVERLAMSEKMLEERGLEDELDNLLKSFPFENTAEWDNRKNSIFIETVGAIVSNQE
jgi:hypothetical protein